MESPRGEQKIERVRLSVKKGTAPAVGSFVELKARLQPPLGPNRPGSYDFGRDMYFAGIGASGFVMGAIRASRAAWRWRLAAALFGRSCRGCAMRSTRASATCWKATSARSQRRC